MNVLLKGLVGSTAYGLNGPDSDKDYLGVYAAPTANFHGLHPPVGRNDTFVSMDPDTTLHEALKFCTLCLKCNPSVLELLWLPDDLYVTLTEHGANLIKIRGAFLSAPKVEAAYLGYALGQFQRLRKRGDGTFAADLRKRTAKHARHILRLLHQGFSLYSTGELQVRVDDPEQYFSFGEKVAEDPEHAFRELNAYDEKFDQTTSALPPHPDHDRVEQWLQEVRADRPRRSRT